MKKLAAFTLFLLSASMALAAKGSVTINNPTSRYYHVLAYDWDDAVRDIESAESVILPGGSGTVTCIKGLFQPNSPGCQIEIHDYHFEEMQRERNDTTRVFGPEKKDTGTYVFNGRSLDPAAVTPPSGAVSLTRTFDMPKPATSSSILEAGNFRLAWQDDGNLVVYKDGSTPVWASKTNGTGANLYFGSGGDLKIYGPGGFNDNKWVVPTYKDQDPDGLGGDRLFLFPDGNLLVLNSSNRALWQTGAPN